MKKAKRERSVRILDMDHIAQTQVRPSPADFMIFFPWACAEFCCPIVPVLHHRVREEFTAKSSDKGKSSRSKKSRPSTAGEGGGGADSAEGGTGGGGGEAGGQELVVIAVYDAHERLVEVALEGDACLPRLVLQVLALCLPFAPHLRTLRVRRLQLDAHSLHELGKFIAPAAAASALTELCLDESPLPEANYYLVLERGRLRRLSLARCALGDAALELLALRLHPPAPASAALRLLDLTSNAISDCGAAHLARALRTNRTLAYLNLAGNRITDVGCFALLDTLRDFPLEYDEIVGARHRRLERARARLADDEERQADEASPVAATRRDGSARCRQLKSASSLIKRHVERSSKVWSGDVDAGDGASDAAPAEPEAPYGYEDTECRDGYAYSVGNTTLACLNLAYNEVEWPGVMRAAATLRLQRGEGLVRLLLEGNRSPSAARGGTAGALAALEAALAAALERALQLCATGNRSPPQPPPSVK